MNRRTIQVGAVLALVAMASFGAWPFWKYLYVRAADAELQRRATELAAQQPHVQLALAVALQDDVLTESEATAIVAGADDAPPPSP